MPLDTSAGRGAESTDRSIRWIEPVIYVLCLFAFANDLGRSDSQPYGIFYSPLVATAVFHRGSRVLWMLVAVALLMVLVGTFFPLANSNLPEPISNRILSIAAILATAMLVHHARTIQDRLVEQTRRVTRAERVKAEALSNLCQEMRTPLHTLLGLLSLMMIECRQDQREALRRVRAGGRQLLATIENLADLAEIDGRRLRHDEVDVIGVLRDAANCAQPVGEDGGVTITIDDSARVKAVGDAWATRRILDNLIANAIRFTPPGGTVSLSVCQDQQRVTACVSDTGRGLPPGLAESLHTAAMRTDPLVPAPTGVGLTLSNRLAEAMNGSLLLESQPGSGAKVSLCLPAALDYQLDAEQEADDGVAA